MEMADSGHWTLPDLYLTVNRILIDNEPALDFHLSGYKLGLPNTHMGITPMGSGYQEMMEDVLNQWEADCKERGISPDAAINLEVLRSKGGRLFEMVLPERLQEKLWDLRHEAQDLMIESSENIPWELMHLQDPNSNEADNFLCLCFHLARWLPDNVYSSSIRMMPALSFKMAPMALIRGESRELTLAADELEGLHARHQVWQPERIESSWEAVNKAMVSARYGAWHFVGHGLKGENRHREMGMLLESAEELTPAILSGACRGAGKRRPLVFWNCCYSSRSAHLFGMRGWPEAFMKHGFGAFIGTLWAVSDRSATTFSKVFYEAFAQGYDLGEAMLQARFAVKAEGSDDWLAYVLYGDPRARFRGVKAQKADPATLLDQLMEDGVLPADHKALLETLAVIAEPVPAFALGAFAWVGEAEVAFFLEHWGDHLQCNNRNHFFPGSELRKMLEQWSTNGLLDTSLAHQRVVSRLLAEVHGIRKAFD